MPNFSKPLGGWGTGAPASNATFYLAVMEEYGDGTVSLIKFVRVLGRDAKWNLSLLLDVGFTYPSMKLSIIPPSNLYNSTCRTQDRKALNQSWCRVYVNIRALMLYIVETLMFRRLDFTHLTSFQLLSYENANCPLVNSNLETNFHKSLPLFAIW